MHHMAQKHTKDYIIHTINDYHITIRASVPTDVEKCYIIIMCHLLM